MDVWSRIMIEEVVGSAKLKKLQKIGDTRWWSKQAALETIFGPYNNQKSGTYFVMLKVLNDIVNHPKFNAKASFEASTLLEKWLQFSNILTAYLLLLVYSILCQASDYLQTSGLDYLSAWNMVQSSKDEIHRIAFDTVYEASTNFTHSMNAKLAEDDLDDIKVESKLKDVRVSRKTRMSGEQASDMVAEDPIVRFRANVFRQVVDQITTSIDERFFQNGQLIKDTAYLDPRRFDEIVVSGVPENSLTKVAKITGVDPLSLKEELCCFARNFTVLSRSLPDESEGASDDAVNMTSTSEEEGSEEESSGNEDVDGSVGKNPVLRNRNAACKRNCKKCLACCHKILFKYSLNTSALTNLFVVYEHLLTLSFTQVSCERAFSKSKQIKTTLRSNLANDKLEAVMLMTSEKDVLDNITVQDIIAILAKGSSVLRQMLVMK